MQRVEGAASERRGRASERPPLRVEASYAVTAWTRAVEDEHRLLSQVLAVLYAYPILPDDVLAGTLANGTQPFPLDDARSRRDAREDKADFWTSIGGQYKASLDYVVFVSCDAGTRYERGPEVRTQTAAAARLGPRAGRRWRSSTALGGVVRDADGEPVANAWVALPAAGLWAASGADGPLPLRPLEPGSYDCVARTADGARGEGRARGPGRRASSSPVAKRQGAGTKRKS